MTPAPAPLSVLHSGNRTQASAPPLAAPKLGLALAPEDVPAPLPIGGVPVRCRLGMHSWLALGMSLSGARHRLAFSFCRHCPATRSA